MEIGCSFGVMAIFLAETLIMLEHPFSVGARVRKLGLLSLHQQAADELGGDNLSRAARKDWGRCWEGLGGHG